MALAVDVDEARHLDFIKRDWFCIKCHNDAKDAFPSDYPFGALTAKYVEIAFCTAPHVDEAYVCAHIQMR